MVWSIDGHAKNIRMGIRESGAISIWGDGRHRPQFTLETHTQSQFAAITSAACFWSFVPSNAANIDLDPNADGLLPLVREAPDQTHISVQFFDNAPLIAFTIALPQTRFDQVMDLFRTVLLNDQLQFVITVDFSGFRAERATTLTPTAAEFLSGKACLTYNKMSLTISHSIPDA